MTTENETTCIVAFGGPWCDDANLCLKKFATGMGLHAFNEITTNLTVEATRTFARKAAQWVQCHNFKTVTVVCAPPHYTRCIQTMHQALQEQGCTAKVQAAYPSRPRRFWFSKDSKNWWARSSLRWRFHEILPWLFSFL